MAKAYGNAGEHAGAQSVAAFKKTILVSIIVIGALCFGEGIVVGIFLTRAGFVRWTLLAAALLVVIYWVAHYAMRRVEEFEKNRLSYRAGFLGEHEVAIELESLSDQFSVFHNVNTNRGNFDHVVIGPTGIFAIETKNWTGMIEANADRELTRNGTRTSRPHVKQLVGRIMQLRDQIAALSQKDDVWIRGLMVFPKASVNAPFGTTGHAHCVQLARLRDYITDEKYSRQLSKDDVEILVRAMRGVAGMDRDFKHTQSPGIPS